MDTSKLVVVAFDFSCQHGASPMPFQCDEIVIMIVPLDNKKPRFESSEIMVFKAVSDAVTYMNDMSADCLMYELTPKCMMTMNRQITPIKNRKPELSDQEEDSASVGRQLEKVA